jgi:hypothetical protein
VRAGFDLSGTPLASAPGLRDLIGGKRIAGGMSVIVDLEPYETVWLSAQIGEQS